MNMPGTVYSCPPSWEKCICHRSSRPGELNTTFITSGGPPLRVPLFMIAPRGRGAWIIPAGVSVHDRDARTGRMDHHFRVRGVHPVVQAKEEVDGPEGVIRAHQLELL